MKPIVRPLNTQVEKVCDLFTPGTRQWNTQLVNNSFCALDAREILNLKPGLRMTEDLDAWALEKNGLYSVRSCYRMLKQESDQRESFELNEPCSSDDRRWWKKVWKLKVLPKVRIFWRRAIQNYLPRRTI